MALLFTHRQRRTHHARILCSAISFIKRLILGSGKCAHTGPSIHHSHHLNFRVPLLSSLISNASFAPHALTRTLPRHRFYRAVLSREFTIGTRQLVHSFDAHGSCNANSMLNKIVKQKIKTKPQRGPLKFSEMAALTANAEAQHIIMNMIKSTGWDRSHTDWDPSFGWPFRHLLSPRTRRHHFEQTGTWEPAVETRYLGHLSMLKHGARHSPSSAWCRTSVCVRACLRARSYVHFYAATTAKRSNTINNRNRSTSKIRNDKHCIRMSALAYILFALTNHHWPSMLQSGTLRCVMRGNDERARLTRNSTHDEWMRPTRWSHGRWVPFLSYVECRYVYHANSGSRIIHSCADALNGTIDWHSIYYFISDIFSTR